MKGKATIAGYEKPIAVQIYAAKAKPLRLTKKQIKELKELNEEPGHVEWVEWVSTSARLEFEMPLIDVTKLDLVRINGVPFLSAEVAVKVVG